MIMEGRVGDDSNESVISIQLLREMIQVDYCNIHSNWLKSSTGVSDH